MRFHIMTLFPDMVLNGLNTSIIGRAVEKGILKIEAWNIRDYAFNKHNSVDDYPYGGGAGMLMQAQPVYDAWQSVMTGIAKRQGADDFSEVANQVRTVYVTPQGRPFTQKMAEEFASCRDLVILSESDMAGVHITASKNGRQIFISGHAEYDRDTLMKEYFRDVNRGLDPDIPYNYFPQDDPSQRPPFIWRSNAHLMISNWLNYFVYQQTPYNLEELQEY